MLLDMLRDPDYERSQRVMAAMLRMKKLDIAELTRAYAG
jgi:predicted 3-demethylubiquinone-9 3-methyltransferase (glyoxalase superfamily)